MSEEQVNGSKVANGRNGHIKCIHTTYPVFLLPSGSVRRTMWRLPVALLLCVMGGRGGSGLELRGAGSDLTQDLFMVGGRVGAWHHANCAVSMLRTLRPVVDLTRLPLRPGLRVPIRQRVRLPRRAPR